MDEKQLDTGLFREPEKNNSQSEAKQLPFDPVEWDDALGTVLGLPDGWAEDVKQEYNDPVAELLYAGLPDAYLGEDPSEIEMNYDSLAAAVNHMEDERRAAVQTLARRALRKFFSPQGTLKHVYERATAIMGSGMPSFGGFKQLANENAEAEVSETAMQNALASLNDPDSPFGEEIPLQDDDTQFDAESHIFEQPPREGDVITLNVDTAYEVTCRVDDITQLRQNGVRRTGLSVTVTESFGDRAPAVGTEATVLPQSLVRRATHHSASD